MIEHVTYVTRRVATITDGMGGKELQIFLEREDAPPFLETALHVTDDFAELRGCEPRPFRSPVVSKAFHAAAL